MKKLLAASAVVLVCVLAVGLGRHFSSPGAKFSSEQRELLRSKGDPSAPVWLVEYFDYQCEVCRQAPGIVEDLFKKYPSKLFFQARFHPLHKHPYALKASIYAECVSRQGRFWPFHDLLFEKQPEWVATPPMEIDNLFASYAASAGADTKKLAACVEDPRVKETVFKETQDGTALGVKVTPTFFVNGKMIMGFEGLEEEIEKQLSAGPGAKK